MTSDLFIALEQIDADNPFSDEHTDKLDKLEKQTRRKEKREKRKDDCGKWSYWFNPHSGKRTGFTFSCELFRDCPTCLTKRAKTESNWLKDASLHKRMVAVKVGKEEASKLLRKIDKAKYLRLPQENGEDLLIVDEEVGIKGEDVQLEWVMDQNWSELVCTPEGRNKSGTIHLPIADETPEDFTVITTKQFITTANRHETIKAMRETEAETVNLNPSTPDDVVKALQRRVSITTSKLKEMGYYVTVYNKQLKVVHNEIDWTGQCVKKRVNTKNLTSPNKSQIALPELNTELSQVLINSP